MDHDAAHKYIYALPEVTADLLRLVLPDWAGRLDWAGMKRALVLMQPAEIRTAVRGRGLDGRWTAGGGLASRQPGGGDGSAATERSAEGAAAAAAGRGGLLPRPGERIVPAGAARLGEGAVGGQDGQGRRLSVL